MKSIPILVLSFPFAGAALAGQLHIRVTDERGALTWTRLEVRGPGDNMYQAPNAILDKTSRNRPGGGPWYLGSFVVGGECTLEVPDGRYTVVAEHGLEYERGERTVDVTSVQPARVSLQLRPWIRMRERGWWSGDMHIHRPPTDVPSLALAEDLNVSVAFTMWNKRDLWAGNPLPDPVVQASPYHLVTLLNAEDERGGGAWMLHGLRERLNLGVDGRWYPPGILFVNEARRQKPAGSPLPFFDSEKPIWWEVPVMMALAMPDSLGLLHNHFNQYGISATEAWGRPRDQKLFPDWPGFVDYSLTLYYRYLNLGFNLPPSAGSASGVLPNPVGYNRVYAKLPDAFSLDAWYNAVRNGDVMVTNGPMLFLSTKPGAGKIEISVEVIAREPIDRVELIANGTVVHAFPVAPGSKHYRGKFSFDPQRHSWVAARAFLKRSATIRLAHSSPVYLPGKWDASADARYFIAWIDDLIRETANDPKRFATPAQRDEVVGLYQKARAYYEAKLR